MFAWLQAKQTKSYDYDNLSKSENLVPSLLVRCWSTFWFISKLSLWGVHNILADIESHWDKLWYLFHSQFIMAPITMHVHVLICVMLKKLYLLDKNECDDLTHNCHSDAYCINTAGSHVCQCKQGYSGNGITCTGNYSCRSGCQVYR